jgi:hypothetical protein
MAHWMNLGQMLKINARHFPTTTALKDRNRSFTYPETNGRVNRLSHSLFGLGLKKGDKVIISGGEYGVLEEVKDNTVVVKIAENVKVKYGKGYIVALRQSEDE